MTDNPVGKQPSRAQEAFGDPAPAFVAITKTSSSFSQTSSPSRTLWRSQISVEAGPRCAARLSAPPPVAERRGPFVAAPPAHAHPSNVVAGLSRQLRLI